jgi:hypothetical protein
MASSDTGSEETVPSWGVLGVENWSDLLYQSREVKKVKKDAFNLEQMRPF